MRLIDIGYKKLSGFFESTMVLVCILKRDKWRRAFFAHCFYVLQLWWWWRCLFLLALPFDQGKWGKAKGN